MKAHFLSAFVVVLGLIPNACAPLFSDMQGARLVGKRQFEVSPGYSSVATVQEGYRKGVANFLGLSAAYGLSDNVDLRFRFEHSWLKKSYSEFGGATNIIGIGPKINLSRDRAALFLPIGVETGGGLIEFHPTVLFTIPLVRDKIDFNPSVKHIAGICDVCWQPLFAFNAGMAISSSVTKWAIRPEYGLLYDFDAPGHFSSFSIGLSVNLSAL